MQLSSQDHLNMNHLPGEGSSGSLGESSLAALAMFLPVTKASYASLVFEVTGHGHLCCLPCHMPSSWAQNPTVIQNCDTRMDTLEQRAPTLDGLPQRDIGYKKHSSLIWNSS